MLSVNQTNMIISSQEDRRRPVSNNEDYIRNEDDLKNEDELKNEDNLKNEGDLKNEYYLKNCETHNGWLESNRIKSNRKMHFD